MKKYSIILLLLVFLFTLTSCKHKHDYKKKDIAPTCTEEGYTLNKCECGDEYKDSIIPAKGHSFGEWKVVTAPQEGVEGLEERTCSCGVVEQNVLPALPHVHNHVATVTEATCIDKGYTTHKCECGDEYVDSYVNAKGHKYGDWKTIKEATTTEEGLREKKCTCGYTVQEVIPMIKEVITYKIDYVLNQDKVIWPSRNADSRNEIVNELYKDLYAWAQSNGEDKSYDDYLVYIKDKLKAYEDIKICNPELGDAPSADGSSEYFLNTPKYYEKWNAFFKIFNKAMTSANSSQSFYTDTQNAIIRLYQFTVWNSDGLSCFRNYVNQMKQAAIIDAEVPYTYNAGDSFTLPSPEHERGFEFLGWYDNPEFNGYPVIEIYDTDEGDKVLYALWDDSIKPTSIDVNKISELLLFNSHQLVWSLTPNDATDQTVEFSSSDNAIAKIDSKGLITTYRNGKVIISIKVVGNRDLDVKFTLTVYTNDYINGYYEDESYLSVGESVQLFAQVVKKDTSLKPVIWSSLNEEIATVDESGLVTGHTGGNATIVATDPDNPELTLEFVVTVFDEDITGIIDLALRSHESNTFVRYDLNIGNTYKKDILGSVNKLLGNSPLIKNTEYYDVANKTPATFGTMSSIEFITVHYTGNMAKGADAQANASYFAGAKDVSIHYTSGNDGVYYCLDESQAAWHAGDSGALSIVGEFKWMPTGVMVKEDDPFYPVFTVSQDFYYEINGQITPIKMPEPWNYKDRYTNHILNEDGTISSNPKYGEDFKGRTPESFINDQSLPFKIVDGEYYMGTTWWCYTQVYEGRICSTGGNRNSIGIESCVNEGSDLWWTWQKTAQLVADIMYRHELDITRVRGHHFFTAKDCPQPMLENDLEIWWEFLDLVEAEYELLSKYNGYSVKIESDNPELVDNCGRVIKQPLNPTCVTYTITFTKGNIVKSVKLASMIQGACVDR